MSKTDDDALTENPPDFPFQMIVEAIDMDWHMFFRLTGKSKETYYRFLRGASQPKKETRVLLALLLRLKLALDKQEFAQMIQEIEQVQAPTADRKRMVAYGLKKSKFA